MAGIGEPLEPLTYKTWVLKVSIHCQGCKRKVNKVLHGIEGVYTVHIDAKQQKVIVTGNVEPETLIRKLIKSRRHAELWPETAEHKEKKSRKSKKKEKDQNDPETNSEEENDDDENDNGAPDVKNTGGGVGHVVVIGGAANQMPVGENGGGGGAAEKTGSGSKRKKKKKKGHKTVTVVEPSSGGAPANTGSHDHFAGPPSVHLSPPRHYGYQFPSPYHATAAPVYAVSHSTAYPTTTTNCYTTSYYASPPCYSSYGYAYSGPELESPPSDLDSYPRKPSDSFEIFSDENPNVCSIM